MLFADGAPLRSEYPEFAEIDGDRRESVGVLRSNGDEKFRVPSTDLGGALEDGAVGVERVEPKNGARRVNERREQHVGIDSAEKLLGTGLGQTRLIAGHVSPATP